MGTKKTCVGFLELIPFKVSVNEGAGNTSSVNLFSNVSKCCVIQNEVLFYFRTRETGQVGNSGDNRQKSNSKQFLDMAGSGLIWIPATG